MRTRELAPAGPGNAGDRYTAVGFIDFHPADGNFAQVTETVIMPLAERDDMTISVFPGRCDHCGSTLRYAALVIDNQTRSVTVLGQNCLPPGLHASKDFTDLQERARQARINRARSNRYAKAQSQLTDDPDLRPIANMTPDQVAQRYGRRAADIYTLIRTGHTITDRQAAALRAAVATPHRTPAATADVPTGEQTIVGTIISHKPIQDTRYNRTIEKIRIRDERGFIAYGTCPAKLLPDPVGRRAMFTATLTASPDDPHFGYFSHPKSAKYLPAANTPQA